jgi:hypothetical protein
MRAKKVTPPGSAGRVTKSDAANPSDKEVADEYSSLVQAAAAGDVKALDRLLMQAQEVA